MKKLIIPVFHEMLTGCSIHIIRWGFLTLELSLSILRRPTLLGVVVRLPVSDSEVSACPWPEVNQWIKSTGNHHPMDLLDETLIVKY